MEERSRISRIGIAVLALLALVITILIISHRRETPSTLVAPVGARPRATAPAGSLTPQPASVEPEAESWTRAPDDAAAFALLAGTEVSQLHDGVALADWMNRRGTPEQWTVTKPEILVDGPGEECLSMRRTDSLPSGGIVVRALYFYSPPAPDPIVFPTADPSSPFDSCTLKIVRLEAQASTAESGHTLALALKQRFERVYGDKPKNKEVSSRIRLHWREDEGHWVGDADIVSNYDGKPGLDPAAPDQLIQGPVVRVYAFLGNPDDRYRNSLTRVDRVAEAAQFRRALALAGLNPGLSQRLEKLYALDVALADRLNQEAEEICKTRCLPEYMPKPSNNDWREPLVPLLQDWFQALKTADPGHRAAALFAAERLLLAFQSVRPGGHFGSPQQSTPEQAKLRSALQDLGATFAVGYGDGLYYFTENWLDQAKDLDLDSEGARLALLTWMASGPSCGQAGPKAFRSIITRGEALLDNNKVAAPIAAQVHFMVGDAYSDIVAIAGGKSGANGEYDPSEFAAEAEADRTKALAHYKAGLAIDSTSENAKDAWRQSSWRLAVGLAPNERYVCFGD